MKKFVLQPGNELRGFKIRLYPDKETEELLLILEQDLKRAWNWLVGQTEDVLQASSAYAVRQGLVSGRPTRPNYDGLTPEESKNIKNKFHEDTMEWYSAVKKATTGLPECQFRKLNDLVDHYLPTPKSKLGTDNEKIIAKKQNYQLLDRVISWKYENESVRKIKPHANTLQALVKNYLTTTKNTRRKKFRKAIDTMPLQTCSTNCFTLGSFGDRRYQPFYNCQISFNGLKIKGRLPGKSPEGRILEGVAITKLADGWWASIKQEVPKRVLPTPVPNSVIGIDVGLDDMAAFSDGTIISNNRGKNYVKLIAEKQFQKKPVGRLHLAAARRTNHIIYNDIIKKLLNVETIKIEKLSSKIGQMGSAKTSVMRKIKSLLAERYGGRVREVVAAYTSQDCSQCGFRSKESWSYEHGRYGECPKCGYREHRDVNSARNIAAKVPIPLDV